jgi:hypothetical protein
VVRYLLVDDRDGRVLAELTRAELSARSLARLARNPAVSLVRLSHEGGDLTDVTSLVSMRPLTPLITRRTRST